MAKINPTQLAALQIVLTNATEDWMPTSVSNVTRGCMIARITALALVRKGLLEETSYEQFSLTNAGKIALASY